MENNGKTAGPAMLNVPAIYESIRQLHVGLMQAARECQVGSVIKTGAVPQLKIGTSTLLHMESSIAFLAERVQQLEAKVTWLLAKETADEGVVATTES